ncbi:hypothetical protein B0T10DRAFT_117116 [Thelonectria olida]|uniref:Uncharacterized protein n=1 Tax=Thelonectria olida TaxID=1576542 RepID=A0A9P8WFV7_9HYPO|nr:hypothetical protein B0T10DRAFT_117116 [Thelonectria olida]
MPPLQPFAAWSRGGRRDDLLKTPEPMAEGDRQLSASPRPPSPPRRFRIKRRNAANLNAPTEQFLASVDAADIPVPSIEEPRVVLDEDMPDNMYSMPELSDMDDMPMTPHGVPERIFSPPKTPAPGAELSLSPERYPNWTIGSTLSSLESSPEYDSSRPSTSHSNHTSTSLLSYFSVSSEDLNQPASPDSEKVEQADKLSFTEDLDKTIRAPQASAKSRKPVWTKRMDDHLWSTYMMYLQDPKVTPFRLSKSGIPPSGAATRIARAASMSWKGSKSGSSTPKSQNSGAFIKWPHTHGATRAHLIELCKASARSSARSSQYMAHSPTPFGRTANRFWNRRAIPGRSASVFSSRDMVMSLAVSTSETMHPQGPLAQLTSSIQDAQPEELPPPPTHTEAFPPVLGHEPLESEAAHLASPFTARNSRSYGPSASSSLPSSFVLDSDFQRPSHTTEPRRALRSPVRLYGSRSTQKRRSQKMLEPRKNKRPSLGSDLYVDPSAHGDEAYEETRVPEFSSSLDERKSLYVPRTNLQELFESRPRAATHQHRTLAPPAEAPPRLGSPFSTTASSHSLPNRHTHSSSIDIGTIRRPYNTFQQSLLNSVDPGPISRTTLTNRLAYIDERLKSFRQRGQPRRRSESPL